MDTIWLWTTRGWFRYVDCPLLGYSDYSGGTVAQSNVAVLLERAGADAVTVDGPYHLGTLNNSIRPGTDKPRADWEPPYLIDVPEPAQVIEYIGRLGTHGVYLLDDDPWCAEQLAALADYPLLDDEAHSRLEVETANERWADMSLRDRYDLIVRFRERYRTGGRTANPADDQVSVFAARRDTYPDDDQGFFRDYLTTP